MAKAVATLEGREEIFTIYKRTPSVAKTKKFYCLTKYINTHLCKTCKWQEDRRKEI